MAEEWRSHPIYSNYKISNLGNIKLREKLMKTRIYKKDNYKYFIFQNAYGGEKRMHLDQIVAYTFLGECPRNYKLIHIDGDRLNNNVNNLKYVIKST